MITFLLPVLIILIALIVITVIVIRHFPQAAAIDLESLPAEQEAAMKAALMERRLKRKILETKNRTVPFFRRIGQGLTKIGQNFQKRISHMEQRYRQKPHTMTSEQQEDVKQKVRLLLSSAKEHQEEEHWTEAENKFIEVLSWDPKNLDAYFGLGEVYYQKKEYQQAKETFSFLLRLIQGQEAGEDSLSVFSSPMTTAQITEAYYDYALSLLQLEDYPGAHKQMLVVMGRDEKNPKYLDKMVELGILLEDRTVAQDALKALKNANPENQKLATFEEQIRELK